MGDYSVCAIIPTFDNPDTIRSVVDSVRTHVSDVIVVDDASGPAARAIIDSLVADGLVDVVRHDVNGGKGAAVKSGLQRAAERGFTHALQVDADGQHAIDDVPKLLAASRAERPTLVLAEPVYDESAPRLRLWARKITLLLTRLETVRRVISDPMCGFRVYPVLPALETKTPADRMDFDPEIAVRLVWSGVSVANVPTRVRYRAKEEGGVSHFRMFHDNALISWMHLRLVFGMLWRFLSGRLGTRGV